MTTFAPYEDGVGFWRAGVLIGVVIRSQLPELIRDAALRLLGDDKAGAGKLVAIIPRDKLPALIYEAASILRQS